LQSVTFLGFIHNFPPKRFRRIEPATLSSGGSTKQIDAVSTVTSGLETSLKVSRLSSSSSSSLRAHTRSSATAATFRAGGSRNADSVSVSFLGSLRSLMPDSGDRSFRLPTLGPML
jgi:hypothetical protein